MAVCSLGEGEVKPRQSVVPPGVCGYPQATRRRWLTQNAAGLAPGCVGPWPGSGSGADLHRGQPHAQPGRSQRLGTLKQDGQSMDHDLIGSDADLLWRKRSFRLRRFAEGPARRVQGPRWFGG